MPKMTLTYKQFPTGAVLKKIGTFTVPKKTKEGPLHAKAPLKIGKHTYVFRFWDAIASLHTHPDLTFTTPDDNSSFAVDAWYVEKGGNGHSYEVSVTGFSLNQHGTFPNTPIASVKYGSGAWTAGSTTVYTNKSKNPVVIKALDKITGYGLYKDWLQFCTKGTTVNNKKRELKVPANGEGQAIAFYGIPVPDPCQVARDKYLNLDCSAPDVVDQKACEALRKSYLATLNTCEKRWGESLTK